jgi:hypothetical protein
MPPTTSPGRPPRDSSAGAPRRGGARPAVLLAIAAALGGCLEYSPHAIPRDEDDRDVHRASLARLFAQPPPEVLRFGVVGDTQGDFDEAELAVERLNERRDLSFVVQVGDFTLLGTAPEYRAMNGIFRRLRVPYFVVVGNHDLLANGGDIYDHMFGARNLAFDYRRTRFVLFDANGVEHGFGGRLPDLAWIRDALRGDEYDQAILFGHVDPLAADFDPALREPYLALLREEGVRHSFYGHLNRPGEGADVGGSLLHVAGDVGRRTFLVVAVHPDGRVDVVRERF